KLQEVDSKPSFALFVSSWLIFRRSRSCRLRRSEPMKKSHGVQASACDFHFRANQGGKLKLELHADFHLRGNQGGKLKLELHAIFLRSLHVALRRPERMKKGMEFKL